MLLDDPFVFSYKTIKVNPSPTAEDVTVKSDIVLV